MDLENGTFLFLSPAVARLLSDNDLDVDELLHRAGTTLPLVTGNDPASESCRRKEPATIILASAAAIAAATPVLKELIRSLSGRPPVLRNRHLVPVEDSSGKVQNDQAGNPILQWKYSASEKIRIKGFGIEISFGDE